MNLERIFFLKTEKWIVWSSTDQSIGLRKVKCFLLLSIVAPLLGSEQDKLSGAPDLNYFGKRNLKDVNSYFTVVSSRKKVRMRGTGIRTLQLLGAEGRIYKLWSVRFWQLRSHCGGCVLICPVSDVRLPLPCKWDLRSSGMLRGVHS